MATLSELRAAVSQLLSTQGVQAAFQLNSNTRERAFEVYVFALVLRAVGRAGGTIQLRGVNSGPDPNPFIFRGGPGHMGSSVQNFGFAVCNINGKEFEVHVDVIFAGSSGATHEVDVSLYDRARADTVRMTPRMIPDSRSLRGALECKFYDSTLGTSLGRTFVGLVNDCGALQVKGFVTNGRNEGLARCFSKGSRPQPYFGVSPLAVSNEERFVADIEQVLRKWAGVA